MVNTPTQMEDTPLVSESKTCDDMSTGLNGGHGSCHGSESTTSNGLLAPLLVEFIGTFFLTFVVADAGKYPYIPGVMLAINIYAGGHVSGGHYNPAVTTAFCLRGGKFPTGMPALLSAMFYIAAQYGAAITAAILRFWILKSSGADGSADYKNLAPYMTLEKIGAVYATGLIQEALFGFLLCYMVLHCATARDNEGNDFYGFAIGGVVVAAGGYAVMNPAVAITQVVQVIRKKQDAKGRLFGRCLPSLVGPYAGAIVAWIMFKLTSPNDLSKECRIDRSD